MGGLLQQALMMQSVQSMLSSSASGEPVLKAAMKLATNYAVASVVPAVTQSLKRRGEVLAAEVSKRVCSAEWWASVLRRGGRDQSSSGSSAASDASAAAAVSADPPPEPALLELYRASRAEVGAVLWHIVARCDPRRVVALGPNEVVPMDFVGVELEGGIRCDVVVKSATPTAPTPNNNMAVGDRYRNGVDGDGGSDGPLVSVDKIVLRKEGHGASVRELRQFVKRCIADKARADAEGDTCFHYTQVAVASRRSFCHGNQFHALFERAPLVTNKSMANLYLDAAVAETLEARLQLFEHNHEWYDRNGIVRTLGILLHGRPGCGKTSFIKALAKRLRRNIFRCNLSKRQIRTADDLRAILEDETIEVAGDGSYRTVPIANRIIVFEEVDASSPLLKRRAEVDGAEDEASKAAKPKKNEDLKVDDEIRVTIGDFLEALDGIKEIPGRVIIMTTNHPELLDPAVTRPGRMDLQIHLGEISGPCAERMIRSMCLRNADDDDAVRKAAALAAGRLTPAQLMCAVQGAGLDVRGVVRELERGV